VATSDNHLNRFYDRMPPQKLEERRGYLRQGFQAAVDHALSWPAHLFCITGDLFDQSDPRNVDRAFVADCLERLRTAGVRVYAVSGNHDTPRHSGQQGGTTPYEVYSYLGALHYFDRIAEIETDVVEIAGLRLAIGGVCPDPAAPAGSDPLAGIVWSNRPADADLGILLLHSPLEGHMPPDWETPQIARQTLETLDGADLILIGDSHQPYTQQIGSRTVIAPGATECMTFGENGDLPGFVALELGRGPRMTWRRIGLQGQPRAELHVRVADLDADDPLADLIRRVRAICTPETLVKLHLEGIVTRDRYHALSLRPLHEAIQPHAFHFTVDTAGLYLEDEQHQVAERGVRASQPEAIRASAAELLASAGGSDERAAIEEALNRLLARY
jgi:DNA repair exonuclease SbcCD nuclease subunit